MKSRKRALALIMCCLLSCRGSRNVRFQPKNIQGGAGVPNELRNLVAAGEGRTVLATGVGKRGIVLGSKLNRDAKAYSRNYAVVIGIDDYKYWPKLQNARNDAYAMVQILQGLGFTVYWLYDRQATRDEIQYMLTDTIGRKVDANDRVVVFFAGHGHTLKLDTGTDLGYIVPENGKTNEYGTLISMTNLLDWSRIIKARQLLFIMDCCYSGLGKLSEFALKTGDHNDKYCRTQQIITAGQENQPVFDAGEGMGRHSVFTEYLINALKDNLADRDKDGLTTGTELGQYLVSEVSRKTGRQQVPDFGQLPGHECGDFIFYPQPVDFVAEQPAWCDISPDNLNFEFYSQFPAGGKINRILFDPVSNSLAAVASSQKLLLWNLEENRVALEAASNTSDIAFTPNGKCLVSVSAKGELVFWDVQTGKMAYRVESPVKPVYSLAVAPDSRRLALGGKGNICVWNILAGTPEFLIQDAHEGIVHSLGFTDSHKLLSVSADLSSKLWDVDLQREIKSISESRDMQRLFTAAFCPDGGIMALGTKTISVNLTRGNRSDTEYIRLRNVDTGNDIWTFEGHDEDITSLAFHGNKQCLASGSVDKSVRFWDIRDRRLFKTIPVSGAVESVNFSPNGCWFAAGSGGQVLLWKLTEERR